MVRPSDKQHVVVITGPVGAGKSTVAQSLADLIRRRHRTRVAVVDLDVIYCMLRQRKGFDEPETWARARRTSAALISALLSDGFGCVVLEREYFSKDHLDALTTHSPELPPFQLFTLDATYPVVLRRVTGDPSRGASREAAFLRQIHESFCAAIPYLQCSGSVVTADDASPEELAGMIAAQLSR